MKTSEHLNEIAAALAKAQGLLKPAVKDAVNPAYRGGYKYADLFAVWTAWQAVGPDCGLAAVQDVATEQDGVSVLTRLIHTSGQWIECGPLVIPLEKPGAHGIGSATSYAKRYSLGAVLGIVAEEDDDGNTAQEAPQKRQQGPKIGRPIEDIGRPENRAPVAPETLQQESEALFPKPSEIADAIAGFEKGSKTCPACGVAGSIIKGKPENGGGWVCWKKRDGCGAKWPDVVPAGTKQSREHMVSLIRQTVEALKLNPKEREALKKTYLNGKTVDDAADDQLEKLYLFLGDGEAVSQWRAAA